MNRIAFAALGILASTAARADMLYLGGRFLGPTEGYVDQLEPPFDQSGVALGSPVDFTSSPLALPHPFSATLDTPNFGEVQLNFDVVTNFIVNFTGVFYKMVGIDSEGQLDAFTINIVNPAYGPTSFGMSAGFNPFTPPPVDPPPVDPPCTDCGPPPPCLTCDPPPVGPAAPEASTWMMMLMGFAGLGYAARRRRYV